MAQVLPHLHPTAPSFSNSPDAHSPPPQVCLQFCFSLKLLSAHVSITTQDLALEVSGPGHSSGLPFAHVLILAELSKESVGPRRHGNRKSTSQNELWEKCRKVRGQKRKSQRDRQKDRTAWEMQVEEIESPDSVTKTPRVQLLAFCMTGQC